MIFNATDTQGSHLMFSSNPADICPNTILALTLQSINELPKFRCPNGIKSGVIDYKTIIISDECGLEIKFIHVVFVENKWFAESDFITNNFNLL